MRLKPPGAEKFLPDRITSLAQLRRASRGCRGCPLYANATQVVFGEGAVRASLLIVGEQPGDVEDKRGKPFVGPSGKVLDEALIEIGIDRKKVYVTNAVKHFKFQLVGKRRLHQKPRDGEVGACRAWVEAELALVRPEIIVCLGATAAHSILHRKAGINAERGRLLASPHGIPVVLTFHPSAILRAPDKDARRRMRAQFVEDIALAFHSLSARAA